MLAGLLPTISTGASGDLDDELVKIIKNAPYPNGCLLYSGGGSGSIRTNPCIDSFSANVPNVKYLIDLGKFCVISIDVYYDDRAKAQLWNYELKYNTQPGGYLKTNEFKSLPVCP